MINEQPATHCKPVTISNSDNLQQAFDYLRTIIKARASISLSKEDDGIDVPSLGYIDDGSLFAELIEKHQPNFYEYLLLVGALATEFAPAVFEEELVSLRQHPEQLKRFAEAHQHSSPFFVPSIESIVYLAAGDTMHHRLTALSCLHSEHWLFTENVLKKLDCFSGQSTEKSNEQQTAIEANSLPLVQHTLCLHPEYRDKMLHNSALTRTNGKLKKGTQNMPKLIAVKTLSTAKQWSDLVLSKNTQKRIKDLIKAIEHSDTLQNEWNMAGKVMPGYRALFHGPSGTGKTLSASLLGKITDRPVQRVDLSQLVSKYIGETEKNLAKLFDQADDKNWILFFDEADALFGKRTSVKDSHDRYANQEVSYLLQRVEEFAGITILATNFKGNMDEAFIRRFNTIIPFELPSADLREKIWRANLPAQQCDKTLLANLNKLASYALSGGSIVNAIQHACLQAIAAKRLVSIDDCSDGIALEMEKQGKVFQVIG